MENDPSIKPLFKSALLQTGKNLSASQRKRLLAVLWKNSDAFQWNPNELSRTSLVEHFIPTGDHKPIQQKQYAIPSVAKEFLDYQIKEMLEKILSVQATVRGVLRCYSLRRSYQMVLPLIVSVSI